MTFDNTQPVKRTQAAPLNPPQRAIADEAAGLQSRCAGIRHSFLMHRPPLKSRQDFGMILIYRVRPYCPHCTVSATRTHLDVHQSFYPSPSILFQLLWGAPTCTTETQVTKNIHFALKRLKNWVIRPHCTTASVCTRLVFFGR